MLCQVYYLRCRMSISAIVGLSQRVASLRAQGCRSVSCPCPEVGANDTGPWVVRVFRRNSGLICAAGEPAVRSGSGENKRTQMARKVKSSYQGLGSVGWERKRGFEAGGNTPLSKAERGGVKVLPPPSLTGSRFADEAHQGMLVGYEVTLQDGHVTGVLPVHGHALESQMFQ